MKLLLVGAFFWFGFLCCWIFDGGVVTVVSQKGTFIGGFDDCRGVVEKGWF